MSLLIKGMEMPTRCYVCPCADLEFYDCNLMPGTNIEKDKRLPNCPLVQVPPHGRLIDADALMKDGWKLHKEVMRMGGRAIHEKPLNYPDITTIIEAEEGNGDAE